MLLLTLPVLVPLTEIGSLIRPEWVAGPAIAAIAGTVAWALARCFAGAPLAANDNHPRLAPLASRR